MNIENLWDNYPPSYSINRSGDMGKVYIMECNGFYKVGVSQDVKKRQKQLQTGNGKEIKILYSSNECINAFEVENLIHKKYKLYQTIGEWFKCNFETISSMIATIEEFIEYKSECKNVNENYKKIPFTDSIKAWEFEKLLIDKENNDIEQLTFDILTGTRKSELSKLIVKTHGESKFMNYCKVIDMLFQRGFKYDNVVDFILTK